MSGSDETYEIGLTMAGAVSAGAYSAGVVDFLIEALDKWHEAKQDRPDEVPDHNVRLKVVSGSSAGGMTGLAMMEALGGSHTPITSLPADEPASPVRNSNKLYSAWVEQIGITPLLSDRDRSDPDQSVNSLLDSTVLDEIADDVLDFAPTTELKKYVGDPLHLLLTVTNLKGVPYDIDFEGSKDAAHRTARHTDYKEFVLSTRGSVQGKGVLLDPSEPGSSAWKRLRSYGLATGAFPGGLEPRHLSRDRSDYDQRKWKIPLRPEEDASSIAWEEVEVNPSWPREERRNGTYEFLAVDGGAMNNEPFELARRKLAGGGNYNPRSPTEATRSVIMIDPLPSQRLIDETGGNDIASVLAGLFDGLMTQARFKPDELILANEADVFNRYLIRPIRRDENGNEEKHPIASEMLGGFGGFLKKSFRMHDFQLGRRNCQRFLQKHFVIPRKACDYNPVFSHYSDEDLEDYCVEVDEEDYPDKDIDEVMPIIHLVEPIRPDQENPETIESRLKWDSNWMKMSESELNDLKRKVESRTKVVVDEMIDQYVGTWYGQLYARMGSFFKRGSIVENIMDKIKWELDEYNLRV